MSARPGLEALSRRVPAAMAGVAIVAALLVAGLVAWRVARHQPSESAAVAELELPRGTRSMALFFASASGDTLLAEQRQVLETDRVTETVRALIEELLRGPSDERDRAVFPRGVVVRHVFFDESGDVFVDFSSALARRFRGGSTAEYLLLASLVRTLSINLPTVTSVTITLEGRPLPSLGGHFSLEGPLLVGDWR